MQEFIWNDLLRDLRDSYPGIIPGYIVVGGLKRCVDLKQITKAEVEKIIDAPNIDIGTEDLTGIACVCIENAMVNHINGNSEAFE
ncbi:MAG: hypothetical protein GYA55_04510 [SAR324 cluster bacterium]|uniref:Uncharacterized protein n=1 Tax=SAR324 cluster bacterium TaxID=2024889 RepID=A0A7X9IJA3_9DELT|nr:hypothetical protein [SAR324 cluster bacterium]